MWVNVASSRYGTTFERWMARKRRPVDGSSVSEAIFTHFRREDRSFQALPSATLWPSSILDHGTGDAFG